MTITRLTRIKPRENRKPRRLRRIRPQTRKTKRKARDIVISLVRKKTGRYQAVATISNQPQVTTVSSTSTPGFSGGVEKLTELDTLFSLLSTRGVESRMH